MTTHTRHDGTTTPTPTTASKAMPTHLPPAAVKLLQQIAEHDHGGGVTFTRLPRAHYKHPHTNTVFVGRTFWPLNDHGLIDIGEHDAAPVRVTDTGRAWLSRAGKQTGARP